MRWRPDRSRRGTHRSGGCGRLSRSQSNHEGGADTEPVAKGGRMIEALKRALAKTAVKAAVKVWLCGSSIEKSLVRSGKEISTPPARNPLDFIPVWGF